MNNKVLKIQKKPSVFICTLTLLILMTFILGCGEGKDACPIKEINPESVEKIEIDVTGMIIETIVDKETIVSFVSVLNDATYRQLDYDLALEGGYSFTFYTSDEVYYATINPNELNINGKWYETEDNLLEPLEGLLNLN